MADARDAGDRFDACLAGQAVALTHNLRHEVEFSALGDGLVDFVRDILAKPEDDCSMSAARMPIRSRSPAMVGVPDLWGDRRKVVSLAGFDHSCSSSSRRRARCYDPLKLLQGPSSPNGVIRATMRGNRSASELARGRAAC